MLLLFRFAEAVTFTIDNECEGIARKDNVIECKLESLLIKFVHEVVKLLEERNVAVDTAVAVDVTTTLGTTTDKKNKRLGIAHQWIIIVYIQQNNWWFLSNH